MKTFGWRFQDGTDWNTGDRYRMFWTFKDKDSWDDDGRKLVIINHAKQIDLRWHEILMIALKGHLDPRAITVSALGKDPYSGNTEWQIIFDEPLRCRFTQDEARRLLEIPNFPHPGTRVSVWEDSGNARDGVHAYCQHCYAELSRKGWRPLVPSVTGPAVIKIEL